MREREVSASGAVVFWNCGETDREKLNSGLDGLGVAPAPQRTDGSALRAAIDDYGTSVHGSRDRAVMVRSNKCPGKNGYSLVLEDKEDERVYHNHSFTARLHDGKVEVSGGYADSGKLQELFTKHKNILPASSMGEHLVRVLDSLGALRLKDSGGVYWVPEQVMGQWYDIARVVEDASVNGRTEVYTISKEVNEEMARCLRTGITRDIKEAVSDLRLKIAQHHGEKALENRKEDAKALHQRVSLYATILEDTLQDLHKEVDNVDELIAEMALLAFGAA